MAAHAPGREGDGDDSPADSSRFSFGFCCLGSGGLHWYFHCGSGRQPGPAHDHFAALRSDRGRRIHRHLFRLRIGRLSALLPVVQERLFHLRRHLRRLHHSSHRVRRRWRNVRRRHQQLRRLRHQQLRPSHRHRPAPAASSARAGHRRHHLQERSRPHRPEPHRVRAHHLQRQLRHLRPAAQPLRHRPCRRPAPLPLPALCRRRHAQRRLRGHRTRYGLRLRFRHRRHPVERLRRQRRIRRRRSQLRPGVPRSRHPPLPSSTAPPARTAPSLSWP